MGKDEYRTAPTYGYCASQGAYYYGYKLHAVCGLSGVIHSFDLTKSRITEKREWHDCVKLSCDKGKTVGNPEKCAYLLKQLA